MHRVRHSPDMTTYQQAILQNIELVQHACETLRFQIEHAWSGTTGGNVGTQRRARGGGAGGFRYNVGAQPVATTVRGQGQTRRRARRRTRQASNVTT
jgi:hypothetical protein